MLINVGGIFIERQRDTSDDPPPNEEPWRVRAIKQLWLDQPNFDFVEAIRHPAFAPYADDLAAWHRLFQKYLASYTERAARWSKRQTKLAPPGDIRVPVDPWEHARRSALYADLMRSLRKDMIDGGHWCWKDRGPLDDD